jgi:hypothetical protein
MPVKKPIRRKKNPARVSKSRRLKRSPRAPWWTRGRAIAAAAICVMTAAVLFAAYQPSDRAGIARAQRKAEMSVARADATQGAASIPSVAARIAAVDTPAVESVPDQKSAPVTITGCLERSDETFRLKDTMGVNAPKSRSWRSAFLRKSSASIDVVDAPTRLNLPDHVGQRVSVTGTLVDREMHVRSLQRVGALCSSPPKVKI